MMIVISLLIYFVAIFGFAALLKPLFNYVRKRRIKKRIKKLAKTYVPNIPPASVATIVCDSIMIRKRLTAMNAAYLATSKSYQEYKERVINEFSEDSARKKI